MKYPATTLSILLITLSIAAPCISCEDDPIELLKAGKPRDVSRLMERVVGCQHLLRQPPAYLNRERDLEIANKEFSCDKIATEEATMRQRYAKHPRVLKDFESLKVFLRGPYAVAPN